MSQSSEQAGIRRILIAIDASPHSLAALQAAADLASALDADLVGIYVEDINLVKLAGHPYVRQVSYYSATPRQFGTRQAEEELRSQANRARRALALAAQRAQLRFNFRVARGVIEQVLLEAAREADLIILGKAGWSRRRRMGSTTRLLINQSPCLIMFLQQGARLGFTIGVLYDGTPASEKALAASASLVQRRAGFLIMLLLASDIEQARALQGKVAGQLQDYELSARFRWLLGPAVRGLAEIVKDEGFGALVVPGEMEALPSEALADLLDQIEAPVLVVR
jgi:nucleotide-binding universal stress UspA family protein